MFVSDLDIWRPANEFIKRHGKDATVHAAMRADKLLAKRDIEGAAGWKRIVRTALPEPPFQCLGHAITIPRAR